MKYDLDEISFFEIKEDFKSLIEVMVDFLDNNNDRFKSFIWNCFCSFVLIPLYLGFYKNLFSFSKIFLMLKWIFEFSSEDFWTLIFKMFFDELISKNFLDILDY